MVASLNILITGNQGYVGPAVVRYLRDAHPDAQMWGYDTAFFAHALSGVADAPERVLTGQYFGDVRNIPGRCFEGVDAVVHLAAISNDPMGSQYEAVTNDVNQAASVACAVKAKAAGVRSFVFASSCSVYGFAPGGARREDDELAPQTAYARSKVGAERALAETGTGDMTVTCLRFATACGMSDRLRLDLVLNDFVASAVAKGEITVLSDGSPWRPLIDVVDMARAIDWAIGRPAKTGGRHLCVNIGSDVWNYQVRDLAEAVQTKVAGTRLSINTDAQPDKRSYRVDFSLFRDLAPAYQPQVTLDASIDRLVDGLTRMNFVDADFRNSTFMRLKLLESHIQSGRLSQNLEWLTGAGGACHDFS